MKRISIDLHGYTADEARSQLMGLLKNCPPGVDEIEVIHGSNRGQAVMNMVRSLSHKKIERKILGLNSGITVLQLRKY
ncbi:MAG: Smr/MutS family protein [Ruminococcus sp.]|nr:Smr/MutS family protein [Ruminococcus sp.]